MALTREQLENEVDAGMHDELYSDYLCNHTDARIGNGDMLILAMESGDYFDGFIDWLEVKQ